MNGNAEMLNFIYQNSQMGVTTIEQLLGIVEDYDFENHLKAELNEYKSINSKAKDLLNSHGYDEKGITALEKLRTYLMINIQTLKDKTASHISEMMILGSNMGVIDAIKRLRQYDGADDHILELMNDLLSFEENNIRVLKGYL